MDLSRRAPVPVAEGLLKHIDCTGGRIRMRIEVGEKNRWFTILNPENIAMKDHAAAEFTCGPQRPRRIRVEYEGADVVRTLEFP